MVEKTLAKQKIEKSSIEQPFSSSSGKFDPAETHYKPKCVAHGGFEILENRFFLDRPRKTRLDPMLCDSILRFAALGLRPPRARRRAAKSTGKAHKAEKRRKEQKRAEKSRKSREKQRRAEKRRNEQRRAGKTRKEQERPEKSRKDQKRVRIGRKEHAGGGACAGRGRCAGQGPGLRGLTRGTKQAGAPMLPAPLKPRCALGGDEKAARKELAFPLAGRSSPFSSGAAARAQGTQRAGAAEKSRLAEGLGEGVGGVGEKVWACAGCPQEQSKLALLPGPRSHAPPAPEAPLRAGRKREGSDKDMAFPPAGRSSPFSLCELRKKGKERQREKKEHLKRRHG